MKAQAIQQRFKFGEMALMGMVNPSNLGSFIIPFPQNLLRRPLMLRNQMGTVVQRADQSLSMRQKIQILPIFRGRVLLERRRPAQRDQKQIPEWMHELSAVVPSERMMRQREFCKRMIITNQADRRGIADLTHDFDARTGLADTESVAGENLPIALGM